METGSAKSACRAATLLLTGLGVQLAGSLASALWPAFGISWLFAVAAFVLAACAASLLHSFVSLLAALCAVALTLLTQFAPAPPLVSLLGVNALYLLLYLPLQSAFDARLTAAHASRQAHRLGRSWSIWLLIGRAASMMGFLPFFEGQQALSLAQGSNTVLFGLQLTLEMIALAAVLISYIYMVRYLRRVQAALTD